MEPRPLEEVYEPAIVRAIDGDERALHEHETETLRGSRRAVTGAAMLSASLTGVAEVLEPETDQAIEEIDEFMHIDHGISGGSSDPVTLYFVPNNPYMTHAIVRPWLFDTTGEGPTT